MRVTMRFLRELRAWRFRFINVVPAGHGQVIRIADRLRGHGLIPAQEVNDSALLGCSMLLTSDEHLCGIDFERLTLELQAFDVAAPVIATPREIVRKFFA